MSGNKKQCTVPLNTLTLQCCFNYRYREALVKWDEALQLTPEDATLYEMKSQVKI